MPRNTVAEQIGHTTIRNLGIASGPSFFFFFYVYDGVLEEENFCWILILIAMKLPFLPSVRPMRKCRVGKQVHEGGHGRRNILLDSHPYSHETSIFTLGAPHEKVQGRQTKLHPGFTMGKLVQPSPGCLSQASRDAHIVLSKRS